MQYYKGGFVSKEKLSGRTIFGHSWMMWRVHVSGTFLWTSGERIASENGYSLMGSPRKSGSLAEVLILIDI
jgi:hypothetical protein